MRKFSGGNRTWIGMQDEEDGLWEMRRALVVKCLLEENVRATEMKARMLSCWIVEFLEILVLNTDWSRTKHSTCSFSLGSNLPPYLPLSKSPFRIRINTYWWLGIGIIFSVTTCHFNMYLLWKCSMFTCTQFRSDDYNHLFDKILPGNILQIPLYISAFNVIAPSSEFWLFSISVKSTRKNKLK